MPTHLNRLFSPVVLVTKGRGREVFEDSAALFRRIEEIPAVGDEVMTIQTGESKVAEAGVMALNYMLQTCGGLKRFRIASKRQSVPARAIGTKYNWRYLGEYLGWDWMPL